MSGIWPIWVLLTCRWNRWWPPGRLYPAGGRSALLFQEYENWWTSSWKENAGRPFQFFHFHLNWSRSLPAQKVDRMCAALSTWPLPRKGISTLPSVCRQEGLPVGGCLAWAYATELSLTFQRAHIYSKEECRRCWPLLLQRGCHANAEFFHGTIFKPYDLGCQLQKKRLNAPLPASKKFAGK